jgi:hypothetical protein
MSYKDSDQHQESARIDGMALGQTDIYSLSFISFPQGNRGTPHGLETG